MINSPEVLLKIPALSEFVGVVRLTISGIATRMNFTVEDIEDIKIAVSEACSNSVQYAYPDTVGEIEIICHLDTDKLQIIIKDTGIGFDINDPKANKKPNPESTNLGLGISFIQNLMDEANFQTSIGQGTIVTMAKYVPKS